MPDPGPEKIAETHLDRINLVSHARVHRGRDMAEHFVQQKIGGTLWIMRILTALDQLRFAVKTHTHSYIGERH